MIHQTDEYWMTHICYLSIQKSVRHRSPVSFTQNEERVSFLAQYKYFVQNFLEACKLRLLLQYDFKRRSTNHRLRLNSKGCTFAKKASEIKFAKNTRAVQETAIRILASIKKHKLTFHGDTFSNNLLQLCYSILSCHCQFFKLLFSFKCKLCFKHTFIKITHRKASSI